MRKYFWIKYLLVAFLAIGLIITSSFIVFRKSLSNMETFVSQVGQSQLEACAIDIEGKLRETERIMKQITTSQEINSLCYTEGPHSNPRTLFTFSQANDFIKTSLSANSVVDNIYLHFQKSDVVFSSSRIFYNQYQLYPDFFQTDSFSWEEWQEFLYQERYYSRWVPGFNTTILQQPDPRVLLIQSLPYPTQSPLGVAVLSIPEENLLEMLGEIALSYEGYGAVEYDGVVMVATPRDGWQPSQDDLLLEYTSPQSGWKYSLSIPHTILMEKVNSLRAFSLVIMSVTVFIVMLLLFFASSKKILDLRSTLSLLEYDNAKKISRDEISFIRDSVDSLSQKNETLKNETKKYKQFLINDFWSKLIYGNFHTLEEAKYYLLQMGPLDLDGFFTVIVLRFFDFSDSAGIAEIEKSNTQKVWVQTQVLEYLPGYLYCVEVEYDKLVIIASSSEKQVISYSPILTDLSQSYNEHFQRKLEFAIGYETKSLLDIASSYHHALSSLLLEHPTPGTLPMPEPEYPYNTYTQAQIISALRSGDLNQVNEIVMDFYYKLLKNQSPDYLIEQYAHDLMFIVINICLPSNFDETLDMNQFQRQIEAFYRSKDSQIKFEIVNGLLIYWCESTTHRSIPSNSVIEEVMLYMEENYQEYSLTLQKTADTFNLSQAYLSSLFKEVTGQNFSSYLEYLRISKSFDLLLVPQYSIGQIASMVGYSGAQVYRRAFKRHTGITPSEYIKNKAENVEVEL